MRNAALLTNFQGGYNSFDILLTNTVTGRNVKVRIQKMNHYKDVKLNKKAGEERIWKCIDYLVAVKGGAL